MPKESSVKIRGSPSLDRRLADQPGMVFAAIFIAIFLLHWPLLQLPYFWDEAGYYVPAARDILLSGSLIPHSTVSNAHPPLVMAWIALWWKVAGYAPLVTRSAMLVVAAFALLGVFRLAESVANTEVAIASTLCTGLYPVFFAQSSLAQVDLAAAGLTFWGLCAYVEERRTATAVWFSLAALAKETAILGPVALVAWECVQLIFPRLNRRAALDRTAEGGCPSMILSVITPVLPLVIWYAYHYAHTGYVFGNPEFFRYNVAATLNPLRFLLALVLRLWQVFGYLHLWVLTAGMLLAMFWPPIKEGAGTVTGNVGTAALGCPVERSSTETDSTQNDRRRIAIPTQMAFLAIVVTYIVAMALIGGAVLARYMLPVVPLVIIVAVSTLRRRLRYWPAAVFVVGIAFVLAWFWNPPYGFSPEDNLAYRDYVDLHEDAERFLEARYPMAHVLTAWPASDELTRPWLGYTTRPMQVVRIEDFSIEEMLSAADFRSHFEVALVFSTKYEPERTLLEKWNTSVATTWLGLKRRFFGYHRDLPPEAAARILGGRVVFLEERKGQWVGVIEMARNEVQSASIESTAVGIIPGTFSQDLSIATHLPNIRQEGK
jgi:hypothetical protein